MEKVARHYATVRIWSVTLYMAVITSSKHQPKIIELVNIIQNITAELIVLIYFFPFKNHPCHTIMYFQLHL